MRIERTLTPPMGALVCMMVAIMLNTPVYAHKIMVFGYLEEGRVHLEGYFADGKKAENSLVEVFAEDGRKLLEGKTDEQGVFSFPMPDVPEVRVVLTGSMGHRAECVVEGDKRVPARQVALAQTKVEKPAEEKPVPVQSSPPCDGGAAAGTAVLDEERMRTIVADEIDRKIAPLTREVMILAQHRTSLTDVIGGIGYIAGFMGLIMYFKARRGSGT